MIALFDGECARCIGDIDEGVTEIRHSAVDGGFICGDCIEDDDLAAKRDGFDCA